MYARARGCATQGRAQAGRAGVGRAQDSTALRAAKRRSERGQGRTQRGVRHAARGMRCVPRWNRTSPPRPTIQGSPSHCRVILLPERAPRPPGERRPPTACRLPAVQWPAPRARGKGAPSTSFRKGWVYQRQASRRVGFSEEQKESEQHPLQQPRSRRAQGAGCWVWAKPTDSQCAGVGGSALPTCPTQRAPCSRGRVQRAKGRGEGHAPPRE